MQRLWSYLFGKEERLDEWIELINEKEENKEDKEVENKINGIKIPGNHVYLYRRMTYKKRGISIFKAGKTTQSNPLKRVKQQTSAFELLCIIQVNNCHITEKEILKYFRENYKSIRDDGVEAFEGDGQDMKKQFMRICQSEND